MRENISKQICLLFVCAMCLVGVSSKVAAATPCPEISFAAPTYFQSGLGTNSLASGDLNEDGKVDIVAANEGSGTITVRFGDGTGAFPSSSQLAVPTPSSVILADFNRDGHLDLASTSRSINRLTVRLGVGDGTLGLPIHTTVGPSPAHLAMGDVNGDGNIDLITSNGGSNSVTFLPGSADGSFPLAATVSIARGSGASSAVVADFNGDGKGDIATANRGTNNISVLFGNGVGSFAPAIVYTAGVEPVSIAAPDMNGDGKADLVTANISSSNITGRINDGLGGFPTAISLSTGAQPLDIATGDLDNDGDTDLVATSQGGNILSVFRGNGNGTFEPRNNFAVNSRSRSLRVADFDTDGLLDIAAGVDSNSVAVLINACVTNTPPTVSGESLGREQNGGTSRSTIAIVTDDQDAPQNLEITVNGGASATRNGVTVANVLVDAVGNVTADVSASCAATDAEFTILVTDSEGLSAAATVNVGVTNETTPPVINGGNPLHDITVYLPVSSPDLSMPVTFEVPPASDNCTASPTVTVSSESGSVFNVGTTLITVTATDAIGNNQKATFSINVMFNFGGFLRPVDPFPMLNIATAGSSVPIKFSLSGNKGLSILSTGYPASSIIDCDENEPGSTVEETLGGGSGLTYDVLSDQYQYVWKTGKELKGTCQILIIRLADGNEHYAKFRFR